jgi:O-antigen/teichoic acid export membrane protein
VGNSKARNLIVGNGLFLIIEYVIKFSLSILVTTWLARHLGPEQYGEFSYITSFGLIFITLIGLGSDDLLIKQLVDRKNDDQSTVMGNALALRSLGSVLAVFIGLASIYLISPEDKSRIFLVSIFIASMFFKSFENINFWLVAEEQIKGVSFIRTISNLIISGLKILFIVKNLDFVWIIYISCFEFILMAFFYLLIYKLKGEKILKWKFDLVETKKVLIESFPVFILMFVMMMTTKIDQLMIEWFKGTKELGFYSVSVKLIDLWQFLPNILLSVLFPTLIRAHSNEGEEYKSNILKLYSVLFWISFSLSLVVSLGSTHIIHLLYGTKFSPSAPLLTLYAWLNIITFFSIGRLKIFIIEGYQSLCLVISVMTLFTNVLFNYILIPRYGAYGAIAASISSHIVSNLICSVFSKNIRSNLFLYFKSVFYPIQLVSGK